MWILSSIKNQIKNIERNISKIEQRTNYYIVEIRRPETIGQRIRIFFHVTLASLRWLNRKWSRRKNESRANTSSNRISAIRFEINEGFSSGCCKSLVELVPAGRIDVGRLAFYEICMFSGYLGKISKSPAPVWYPSSLQTRFDVETNPDTDAIWQKGWNLFHKTKYNQVAHYHE